MTRTPFSQEIRRPPPGQLRPEVCRPGAIWTSPDRWCRVARESRPAQPVTRVSPSGASRAAGGPSGSTRRPNSTAWDRCFARATPAPGSDRWLPGSARSSYHRGPTVPPHTQQGGQVDLLRILDDSLPGGTWTGLAFAATDRNWVNWVRGGSFNPSGTIRIPTVLGDGTGVLGTATQRRLHVRAGPGGDGMPPLCGPPAPADA